VRPELTSVLSALLLGSRNMVINERGKWAFSRDGRKVVEILSVVLIPPALPTGSSRSSVPHQTNDIGTHAGIRLSHILTF